tara:strand:- start:527 stop:688 length:162 start_codon:yes stop_codon:yes gene_type:complete
MIDTHMFQHLFLKIKHDKSNLKDYKNEIADLIIIFRLANSNYPLEYIEFLNNK